MTDSTTSFTSALRTLSLFAGVFLGAIVLMVSHDPVLALVIGVMGYIIGNSVLSSLARNKAPSDSAETTMPASDQTRPAQRSRRQQRGNPSSHSRPPTADSYRDDSDRPFQSTREQVVDDDFGRQRVDAEETRRPGVAQRAVDKMFDVEQDAVGKLKKKLAALRENKADEIEAASEATAQEIDKIARNPEDATGKMRGHAVKHRTTKRIPTDVWLDEMHVLDRMVATGQVDDEEYERQYNRIIRRRDRALEKALKAELASKTD